MSAEPDLLVIYGATGSTGQELVKQALENGFRVRAFVRDVSKLPAECSSHENFDSFVGDLADTGAVTRALEGATYAICAAGSQPLWVNGGMTKMVKAIAEAMPSSGLKRFLYQAGAFSPMPGEKQSAILKLMKLVFGTIMKLNDAIRDNTDALEALCDAQDVEWCATRPGKIVVAESKGKLKEGTKAGVTVTFKDLAALELEMVRSDSYNGKAVYPVYD